MSADPQVLHTEITIRLQTSWLVLLPIGREGWLESDCLESSCKYLNIDDLNRQYFTSPSRTSTCADGVFCTYQLVGYILWRQ